MVWVTGVNTGVGKTFLTRHCVCCLQEMGISFNALKPFCSGGVDDVRELALAQGLSECEFNKINMKCFKEPITPAKAAELEGDELLLGETIDWIQSKRQGVEITLVEGAGGILSPLGFCWSLLDLIRALPGEVWIVAKNQLGVLNHLLLITNVLRNAFELRSGTRNVGLIQLPTIKVWLFDVPPSEKDESRSSNSEVFKRFEPRVAVEEVIFFDSQSVVVQQHIISFQKKIKKHLSKIKKSID